MWYNDDKMTYNELTHRYELTEAAIFNAYGDNLNTIFGDSPDVNTKAAFLKDVSAQVYGGILDHSQSPDYIEYILAMDTTLRNLVLQMLLAQAKYMLNGGNVAAFSGINLAKGQWIDIDKLRGDARVAVEVVDIASRILPGYGHALIYSGRLPHITRAALYNGY